MQQPEWKGSQPQRWSGGRMHLTTHDELNHVFISNTQPHSQGIKTYQHQHTPEYVFKPCLKVYPEGEPTKNIDLRGKKALQPTPQPERIRKEKGHVSGGCETNQQDALKGLKTYQEANRSRNKEYYVESRMQTKARMYGLEQQRNGVGISALGDKEYKYPEYQTDFYKDGGLVAGSTGFRQRGYRTGSIDPNKGKFVLTKPMWSQVVKQEAKRQEVDYINSLDNWQQSTLKEANPNWNDPDTFFDRMAQAGNANAGNKKKK